MKLEQIWGRVARHLLKQNAVSKRLPGLSSNVACLYRGPDGMKCAVGCLIDDRFYDHRLENKTIMTPAVRRAVEASLDTAITPPMLHLLRCLQSMHDYKEPEDWADSLAKTARVLNLNPEECLAELRA